MFPFIDWHTRPHFLSSSTSFSGADIARQVARVVVLAQIANNSQPVSLVDHLISSNSVPERPGHTPNAWFQVVLDLSVLSVDLCSLRAINTSLNRSPINSKLSKALGSGFLRLRGGRHAVEQLHLHHHVGDMVDRAALHNVPSTFPWAVLTIKSVAVLSVAMSRGTSVSNELDIKELRQGCVGW